MEKYKIEKNVPLVRTTLAFDKETPEYIVMTKMKVGDSFEFHKDRINIVLNSRAHLHTEGSPLCFTTTTKEAFKKDPKKQTGRCWRIEDNSRKTRAKHKR